MLLKDIYRVLDSISPFELQEEWDNSGLQLGNPNKTITKVYLTLDIDEEVVSYAETNSLIISHHPLIFRNLRRITPEQATGKYIIGLIKKNISLISLHTNIDKTHLNRYFAEEVLQWKGEQKGLVYYATLNMTLEEIAPLIKSRLGLEMMRVVPAREFIRRGAVVTGSGMSILDLLEEDVDLLLTGDIKYHEAMEAKGRGITLIDIGHYESERYFTTMMYDLLKDKLEVDLQIINSTNPFVLM
ncbi:MAG: Nif3-like dinuclear metal center hexameric protein [Epsilonproteobacteria bacterium]|nr:Nif3-like dinuclear metal center hexameric protein [Campylobacterota bacterium]NPA89291.1 Nif3-like dinuclear metal center hexameric protein [Campylobacterota bacterium]